MKQPATTRTNSETTTERLVSESAVADTLSEWLPELAYAISKIRHGRVELSITDGQIRELQLTEKIREPRRRR